MDEISGLKNPQEMLRYWRRRRPGTRGELAAYVEAFLGWRIPDRRVCVGHDAPMDYLGWALGVEKGDNGLGVEEKPLPCVQGSLKRGSVQDAVVWANRGGGKTQLGAVASLLECIFNRGVRCGYWVGRRISRRGCMVTCGVVLSVSFRIWLRGG
jgi:hypothetical protein